MYIVYTFVFMSNKIVSYLILSYLRCQMQCPIPQNSRSDMEMQTNYTDDIKWGSYLLLLISV